MKRIPLTKGYSAIIDDEDYSKVGHLKWCFCNGYASRAVRTHGKKQTVYMHRVILDAPQGMDVDHKNHDTLDNRRENIWICTRRENLQNLKHKTRIMAGSGYKGVYPHRNKWQVKVSMNGTEMHVGIYDTKQEAALYYNVAAQLFLGKNTYLNAI